MSTSSAGLFISIEGGEAVGKSTLITGLRELLHNENIAAVITREPGGTPFAERIRSLLFMHEDPPSSYAELLAILAARADHLEKVVIPSLTANKTVLCDRFIDSTIAYQGGGRELGFEQVRDLCLQISGNTLPRITLLLDLPIAAAISRQQKRASSLDRFEAAGNNFAEVVRQNFLRLAREFPERIHLINAALPSEQVLEVAWKIISPRLKGLLLEKH